MLTSNNCEEVQNAEMAKSQRGELVKFGSRQHLECLDQRKVFSRGEIINHGEIPEAETLLGVVGLEAILRTGQIQV